MSHSYYNIWIHVIWATKERKPMIEPSIENEVFTFIKDQFIENNCRVGIINGMPDHIRCLFSINPNKSIAELIKQVKGSSSHYINQNDLVKEKFAWQTGYAAYSVSNSVKGKVFEYIKNQKVHHKKQNSQKEFDEFLKLNGILTENG